jgi:hypothetical protein
MKQTEEAHCPQVIAFILGIIYLQQNLDQNGVMNINGAIFILITNLSFRHLEHQLGDRLYSCVKNRIQFLHSFFRCMTSSKIGSAAAEIL